MQPVDRRKVKDLFLELEELDGDDRQRRLETITNADVRAAVQELLGASQRAEGILGAVTPAVVEQAATGVDLSGERVGPYEIVRPLGTGGMGEVWLAQRADGEFEREVAVKLLSQTAWTQEARDRFHAEREILARLAHPGIAAIFDSGIAGDGRPYFVMEYVDGEPIDTYCDAQKLDIDARVRLVRDVARAVAHAHEHGIVHRDLKPANVLVNRQGQPKLLDFGIAKVVAHDQGIASAITGTGQAPMTLAFASPEQLRGEAVTPATDVYALGTLLCLLLTGEMPHGDHDGSQLALVRAICEDDVRRPSQRFSTGTSQAAGTRAIASTRATSVPALHRQLRGDLDLIVMMALRKEPVRRYPDASELADDLQRHFDHYPLVARSDTTMYRLTRFARRHRGATVIAGIAATLLAIAGAVAWSFARQNRERSREIESQREDHGSLLGQLKGLYQAADPWNPGSTAASRPVLDAAVERLRLAPPAHRETRAELYLAAGRVYRRLAEYDIAAELLSQAVELGEIEPAIADLPEALLELGRSWMRVGETEQAIERLRQSLELELEQVGPDHLRVARVRQELGTALHDTRQPGANGEFQEAARIFREHSERPDGLPKEEYAESLRMLAQTLTFTNEYEDAAEFMERALSLWAEVRGPEHLAHADAAEGLGLIYGKLDRADEGIELMRGALAVRRRTLAEKDHPLLAWNLLNLGGTLAANGEHDEGLPMIDQAIEMFGRIPTTPENVVMFAKHQRKKLTPREEKVID